MSRHSLFLAALAGGTLLATLGSGSAQIYSPYPSRSDQSDYGYRSAPQRGYYAATPDDDDDYIQTTPRQSMRPIQPLPRQRAVARNQDDDDDNYQPVAPRSRIQSSPLPLPGATIGTGSASPKRGGVRVASLPPDADPAYSTPISYDAEVDSSEQTRHLVSDPTNQPANTITINTRQRKLYLSLGDGRAIEYGVGVGREGFLWKGTAQVGRKAFWPGWTPPPEMILRRPDLPKHMEGGMDNPLGARALYLFKGNKDTMFRIHGTNEPDTIGHAVSSGCIRMMNADVMDLYQRVAKGAKVNVI
jgi:lipoprotein-anchoring transpeptidase ErfK/SrfK